MRKIFNILFIIGFILLPSFIMAQSHIDDLHGDQQYHVRAIHDGNQIRCDFGNDGMFGRRGAGHQAGTTGSLAGEWPANSGHFYMAKIIMLPMAEVRDIHGNIQQIVSECHGTGTSWAYGWIQSVGDLDVSGRWRTMCPLPDFMNMDLFASGHGSPALSDQPNTWPSYWPDVMNDPSDPGWAGEWNGYFGKGQIEADQESYFVTDDYQNDEFEYYPDENDLSRRGTGLRKYYRGLQWANPLVRDVLFMIYDVQNIGTSTLDKINFAVYPNIKCGDSVLGNDASRDSTVFERENNWFHVSDSDNLGYNNFTPVARVGYALYETPGNEFDGIDNDNDGFNGSGVVLTEAMFEPALLEEGTQIVIVDYDSYNREVTTMADWKVAHPDAFDGDTLIIEFIGRQKKFWPGMQIEEQRFNNFDDNLNGIIDENNGAVFGDNPETQEIRYLYVGNKVVDYFSGLGTDNLMLDESRSDGIDNNNDWTIQDDVGLDGKPFTGDFGEKDGMPTSKYQNGIPMDGKGEPHIDATDVNESDMLGMTAFGPNPGDWTEYPLMDDQVLWEACTPGNMARAGERIENQFMGSGYFPLMPQQIERFSGGYMFNYSLEGLVRTKGNAGQAYENNYQFFKAPNRPVLTAVPGDGRVILYWDSNAENSIDPILGPDFEGYRIYRSTGTQFSEMTSITDAFGDERFLSPIAQFDLDNNIYGLSSGVIEGVQFNLGTDTGLRHSWIDTTVVNGYRYFYYITSYDHGDNERMIAPTECSKILNLDPTTGDISKISENVAVAVPNAPSAGYMDADLGEITPVKGITDGSISYAIEHPSNVPDNHTYQITFQDTFKLVPGSAFIHRATKSYSLIDLVESDTLLKEIPIGEPDEELPLTDGFRLSIKNASQGENQGLLELDAGKGGWSRPDIYNDYVFKVAAYRQNIGMSLPADYIIEFGDVGVDTSSYLEGFTAKPLEPIPVNFKVFNLTEQKYIEFAFEENDVSGDEHGQMTFDTKGRRKTDKIFFLEMIDDSLTVGWEFSFSPAQDETNDDASVATSKNRNPINGDIMELFTIKPLLADHVFEFISKGEKIDETLAKNELERIRVVPNPYVVTNAWEVPNPYSTGRGSRAIHFTHLPAKCTIKIFNIAGQHVATIERDGMISDGTESWDMLSRDQMEIGFGVYIYHVDAGDIGHKIGKFAVIK